MSTVTVDRASFLDRVNQICQESSDEVKRIVAPGDQTNVTEEQLPAWSAYFQQILPPIEKEQTELRALTPPSGDAGAFNAILDDQAAGIDDLQALQRAAAQSDLPAFQAAMKPVWDQYGAEHAEMIERIQAVQ